MLINVVLAVWLILGRSTEASPIRPIQSEPDGANKVDENSVGGMVVEKVQSQMQLVTEEDNYFDYKSMIDKYKSMIDNIPKILQQLLMGDSSPNQEPEETRPGCHMVERVRFEDVCEKYNQTTCYTQNKEVCEEYPMKNCTSVVKTEVEKECFDVTELMCSLVEDTNYQTVRETYQVQRCFYTKDRICDTVFAMDFMSEDEFHCIEVEAPNCHTEEIQLKDISCTDTTDFDCKIISYDQDYFPPSWLPGKVYCERRPRRDCYDVPRTVNMERCEVLTHRYCEKLTNQNPVPYETQNCHFEAKKICEIQDRTRIKKGKKYSYRTHCEEVPRQICDQAEKKVLEAVCSMESRMQCKYHPEETCEEEEKSKCFVVEDTVLEEVCDMKIDTSYL